MKIITILGLACVLALSASLRGHEIQQQQIQRWEYATLTFGFRDLLVPYSWKSAAEDIRDVNPRELVRRFKGLEKEPEANDYFLWDVIGDRGWELVGVSNTSAGVVYIFKRPKPLPTT